jgi:hypothetical protein
MSLSAPIFEPRRQTNENFPRPSQGTLHFFLTHTIKECGRELHNDDMEPYRRLLNEVDAFAKLKLPGAEQPDVREWLLYGMLANSRFINDALPLAVEEYKYYLHALLALDFRSPVTLIKSLELETGKLSMQRTRDIVLRVKFQEMIAGQKRILSRVMRRYVLLSGEMSHIAHYVRANLAKIEERCDAAVSMLSDAVVGKARERQLIEEIRAHFKLQLKDARSRGGVTRQDLENAKHEFAQLVQTISELVVKDAAVIKGLHRELGAHVKRRGNAIELLLSEIKEKKDASVKENRDLFRHVGDELVALLSCRLADTAKVEKSEGNAAQVSLIGAIRKQMIDHLLETVGKGRRSRGDRRTTPDRRIGADPLYRGPERRSGKTRRTGTARRRGMAASDPALASRSMAGVS